MILMSFVDVEITHSLVDLFSFFFWTVMEIKQWVSVVSCAYKMQLITDNI
ncbi:MAG: hypothetical protein K9L74_02490 [Candidatus Izimaplasma sp.]|nr:hypothetical protein [Candidatus Izimaplasma bacterium]